MEMMMMMRIMTEDQVLQILATGLSCNSKM